MKLQAAKPKNTHTPFIKREQTPLFKKREQPKPKTDETTTENVAEKKTETNNNTTKTSSSTFIPPKNKAVTPKQSKATKSEKSITQKNTVTPTNSITKTPTAQETTEKTSPTPVSPENKNITQAPQVKDSTEVSKSIDGTTAIKKEDKKIGTPLKSAKKKQAKSKKGKQAPILPVSEESAVEKKSAAEQPAKEVVVSLPTENTQAFTKGLASQSPSNFVRGLKQSGPSLQQTLSNEKDSLKESLPEIEQPTGVATKKAAAESNKQTQAKKDATSLANSKTELQDLSPTGKKEGEKVVEESKQPKSTFLDKIKSFFSFFGSDDDKKSSVKRSIKKLPTSENVNTSAGERPNVDLTGQANPQQNASNKEASDVTMQEAQQKNKTESDLYKGEDDIYPEMEIEMLSPSTELTPAQATTALEQGLPPVTGDVEAAFNANSKDYYEPELAPQVAKQDADYKKMQQDQEKEQQLSDQKIAEETQRVKTEQEAAQKGAKQEVSAQRTQWKKENEDVKKEYATKSEKEKKRIDGEIDTKVAETDTQVTKEYDTAEKKADNKVAETNKEAEKRKRDAKAKSEKKSWWDRAVDAVSDFFDKLKEGLNKLFDGLKSLVKGIIEAAKKLVNKLIDLARDFVVGLIKAFGEILKGLVNIALAAFPKLRDKFNAAIDKAVNAAVKTVNALAEGLKKIANALLDALGKVLDFILSAYQALFNALLDVLKFLAVGLIKVMQFLWNLIKGAGIAPFEFFGQLAEESLGGNPADPLKDVEVPLGQEKNWANAMGLSEGTTKSEGGVASETMSKEVQQLLTKKELADSDVAIEPYPAVTLDPELLTQLPNLKDGELFELGGAGGDAVTTEQFQASAADAAGYNIPTTSADAISEGTKETAATEAPETPTPDWRAMSDEEKLTHYNAQMLNESAAAGNTKPTPEGKKAPAATVDNSPEALITKTGRLEVARRLAFMGEQMMTGLQVFWNKNKVWIIAALVAALIAAGLIAFFTGGAGLVAAVDIIAKALIIIFGAIAVFKAMGYIWEYVKKAWAGDAQGAGKALARALAVIVVEFLIDKILMGMGKVFKRILNAAKATKVGRFVTKGAKVVRKGAQKGVNVVKKGLAKIKNSKLVVKMSGGIGKGVKKLGKLRQKILDKFKFKRIWFVRKGFRIQIWGEFNAKILMADIADDGSVSNVRIKTSNSKGVRKRIGGKNNKIVGKKNAKNEIVVADDANKFSRKLEEMHADGKQQELTDIFEDLQQKNLLERRKTIKNQNEFDPASFKKKFPGEDADVLDKAADVISKRDTINKNFSKLESKPTGVDNEVHHLIPVEVLSNTGEAGTIMRKAVKDGFDFNCTSKATNGAWVKRYSSKSGNPKATPSGIHASHPNYTQHVMDRLVALKKRGLTDYQAARRVAVEMKVAIKKLNPGEKINDMF